MALGWSLVSLTPVGSVPTTPMLGVRPTTVADAMQSTTMREETMSLTTAEQEQVYNCSSASEYCLHVEGVHMY